MYKFVAALALFIAHPVLWAQITPGENSKLHYRLIGFSFPAVAGCDGYRLEIAQGRLNTEDSFRKNVSNTYWIDNNRVIAEVPYFGVDYTWQVVCLSQKAVKGRSELHHFSTTIIPDMDTNNTRVRITKNTGIYKDALVCLDGNRAIYDMKGHPIWYLPSISGMNNERLRDVRDMKLTPQGTITFLLNNVGYEINYDGTVLWKAPDDGQVSHFKSEFYHHEFTKLENGHYMILGDEYPLWKMPVNADSTITRDVHTIYDTINKVYCQKIKFGTIIEYDEKGNVVWSWRSTTYFQESDLKDNINAIGKFRDMHENSFCFDEHKKELLVSFRNISRVVKLRYPSGDTIATYGNRYVPGGTTELGNNLFCNQHSVKRTKQGYILLFNNNCCNKEETPRIIIMKEPAHGGPLEKKWEYSCVLEGTTLKRNLQFRSGGNVIELPDNSIFTSLATDLYSNIFIVSEDKKVQWSAMPEKWNLLESKWEPVFQYRASIITDQKDKERLIWNGTVKN